MNGRRMEDIEMPFDALGRLDGSGGLTGMIPFLSKSDPELAGKTPVNLAQDLLAAIDRLADGPLGGVLSSVPVIGTVVSLTGDIAGFTADLEQTYEYGFHNGNAALLGEATAVVLDALQATVTDAVTAAVVGATAGTALPVAVIVPTVVDAAFDFVVIPVAQSAVEDAYFLGLTVADRTGALDLANGVLDSTGVSGVVGRITGIDISESLPDAEGVDLAVLGLDATDTSLRLTQNLELSADVANLGGQIASGVTTTFFWSDDDQFDFGEDARLGCSAEAILFGGQVAQDEARTVLWPGLALRGDGYVFAVVDAEDRVAELDETNNVSDALFVSHELVFA
jgi:hypothetical protein